MKRYFEKLPSGATITHRGVSPCSNKEMSVVATYRGVTLHKLWCYINKAQGDYFSYWQADIEVPGGDTWENVVGHPDNGYKPTNKYNL